MSLQLFRYYAKNVTKKILPSSAWQQLRNIKLRHKASFRRKAKSDAIARYGYFNVAQMREALKSVEIKRGGILFVQSSLNRFYNFKGTAIDILLLLEEIIGPEGTLIMPSFPGYSEEGLFFFDVRKTPAQTGLLCELLRRRPDVIRSLNPPHSVCAIGPMAEELLSEHHLSPFTCGSKSPFAKIADHGGQILGLGLPPGCTTFFHVVEDIDPEKYPRPIYVRKPVDYTVINETGQKLSVSVCLRNPKVTTTMKLERVTQHLSEQAHRVFSIYGVPAFIADAKLLLGELCSLRDKGIILYD
jgi:aminoglycoside 3-N-acetyltransferase